ncbi:MAG: DUF2163 domain-containing protein [Pseudomonadota bacterium]
MKTASQALIDLLHNGSQFYMADLYTLELIDGTTLRHTSADIDLALDGASYAAGGLHFKRGRVREAAGIKVDGLDLTASADAGYLLGGVPFPHAVANGALDGAYLTLRRVFMPSPGDTSPGALVRFVGRVSKVTPGRTETRLSVKSDLEILNIKMPRNVYAPACSHTVYDSGCGLDKSVWAVAATADNGSGRSQLLCGLAQAAGYFDLGYLVFTSGANTGVKRTVRSYTPGVVSLSLPLPNAPAAGDAFTIYPGCDRTLGGNGCPKFSNQARFRGYPYVPVPETAL